MDETTGMFQPYPSQSSSLKRRLIMAATFCVVFLEAIVLVRLLLNRLALGDWPLTSIAIAYVFLGFVREPVDRWITSDETVPTS